MAYRSNEKILVSLKYMALFLKICKAGTWTGWYQIQIQILLSLNNTVCDNYTINM